ncbi:S-adenosyl-L-methionine-dependent methyltransferase [Cercophora scortea]|uniref:S-adenosyl-L-methionine-dependent methyltransferase n=1 Tax=Cercophora scortea TaxID=314031 RepID=A0AAE0IVV0_9PEZI|nr:S-adenosyl-L-methionine-dependent methyltransferase [Cercophora scortea]
MSSRMPFRGAQLPRQIRTARCSLGLGLSSVQSTRAANFSLSTSGGLRAKASPRQPRATNTPTKPKPLDKPQSYRQSPSPPPPPPPPSSNTANSKPQPPPPQTIDELFQQRKWSLMGAGIMALGIGLYVSMLVTSHLKEPSPALAQQQPPNHSGTCTHLSHSNEPLPPTGRPSAVDTALAAGQNPDEIRQSALQFDLGLDVPEAFMGLLAHRKFLASRARGHVLEVAVGTGRNLAYYDWTELVAAVARETADTISPSEAADTPADSKRVVKVLDNLKPGSGTKLTDDAHKGKLAPGGMDGEVLSFTGVDISSDMMSIARTRLRETVPGLDKVLRKRRVEPLPDATTDGPTVMVDVLNSRVRLVTADAQQTLPAPPQISSPSSPPTKYDTIMQTFGLCSVADPARLLANMAAVLQPDTGRIVLLEHGRGWFDWVNRLLDQYAPRHFQRYGCWWNRDIEGLVREAARTVPGLEVVALKRPGFLQFGTTLMIELKINSQKTLSAEGAARANKA